MLSDWLFYVLLDCAYVELVGNGYCNDETNNEGCNFDGGDCCLNCINTDQCSDCVCYEGGAPAIDTSCKCFILIVRYYLTLKDSLSLL